MFLALVETHWQVGTCANVGSAYVVGNTLLHQPTLIVAVVVVATLIAIWLQSRQTNRIAEAELTLECWTNAEASQREMVDTPEKTEFVHLILWEPRKPTPVEMQRCLSPVKLSHYLGRSED